MAVRGTIAWPALVAAFLGTIAGHAQAGPAGSGGADYLAGVEGAARSLGQQLDLLQDAIADEPQGRRGRGVWAQSSKVSLDLTFLRQQLKTKASRADLYQAFVRLDDRLQALLGEIRGLGPEERPLKMAGARMQVALDNLHFAVSAGDDSAGRGAQVMTRQTQALAAAAQDLERVAGYLLAGQDSWAALKGDFSKLRQASGAFQASLSGKPNPKAVKGQFAKVQEAWAPLTVDYGLLSSTNRMLLQNKAEPLDAIYGRLFTLVGLKGYRPRLVGGN
jgi:hypothetical protein